MKKTTLLTALATAALVLCAGSARAASSGNLSVTANVEGACEFVTSAPVAFGALNPATSPDPVTAGGSVNFWCTKGASYTLTMNDGANASGTQKRMKGPGASDYIPYAVVPASTTGTGAGKSTEVQVLMNGTVAKSAFIDATEGAYSDTVLVTITPTP